MNDQDLTLRAVVPTENSTWPLQSLACASRKSRNVRAEGFIFPS